MSKISQEALAQLFTEARTYGFYQPKPVSDETLHELYELTKWGPTSVNLAPMRVVFVRSEAAKAKLIPSLMEMNIDKVKSAPVTAIIAFDEKFFDHIGKLYPPGVAYRSMFADNPQLAQDTQMRNSSLQAGYFTMAARALGLDCGPISGFDNKKLDEAFFADTSWKSNLIINIGYGDKSKLFPRLPRLEFGEACRIE